MKEHIRSDAIKKKDVRDFKSEARKLVIGMVAKLAERSTINSVIVRNALVFDPNVMVKHTHENLIANFKTLTQAMVELKVLEFKTADGALPQYRQFLAKDMEKFIQFDREKERLDDFSFHRLKVHANYHELVDSIILVLTSKCRERFQHKQACSESEYWRRYTCF